MESSRSLPIPGSDVTVRELIGFLRLPPGCKLVVHGETDREAALTMTVPAHDLRSGESKNLHAGWTLLKITEEEAVREIRATLHMMLTHEADEWLSYDGHRLWDPHKPKQVFIRANAPKFRFLMPKLLGLSGEIEIEEYV